MIQCVIRLERDKTMRVASSMCMASNFIMQPSQWSAFISLTEYLLPTRGYPQPHHSKCLSRWFKEQQWPKLLKVLLEHKSHQSMWKAQHNLPKMLQKRIQYQCVITLKKRDNIFEVNTNLEIVHDLDILYAMRAMVLYDMLYGIHMFTRPKMEE